MESFGNLFALLQGIKTHCDNIRLHHEVYGRLKSLLDVFEPLLRDYVTAQKDHGEGTPEAADPPWKTALERALSEAILALDECARHPVRTRLFPSHYVGKLSAARCSIRDAVDAIAVGNAAAARRTEDAIAVLGRRLDGYRREGEAFVAELTEALRSDGGGGTSPLSRAAAIDAVAVRHGVDPSTMDKLRRQLAGEEAHCRARLRSVKDAAERREVELAIELSTLVAGTMDSCPNDFRCPITLGVMEDPTMLVQSGHTYEGKAIRIALVHRPNVDPKTNARFEGEAMLAPNHSLRGSIEQWKADMSSMWSRPEEERPNAETPPLASIASLTLNGSLSNPDSSANEPHGRPQQGSNQDGSTAEPNVLVDPLAGSDHLGGDVSMAFRDSLPNPYSSAKSPFTPKTDTFEGVNPYGLASTSEKPPASIRSQTPNGILPNPYSSASNPYGGSQQGDRNGHTSEKWLCRRKCGDFFT